MNYISMSPVAELVKADMPFSSGAGGVSSIPASCVPSFRRWRFEMKLNTSISIVSMFYLRQQDSSITLLGNGSAAASIAARAIR